MPQNPPEGHPRISPYLLYEDVAGALDFLSRAFGFSERFRFADPQDDVTHAEMVLADGLIMMGDPGPDYESPKRAGRLGSQVHVYVDDVDAHFEHAKAAGATIVSELHEPGYGDRRYDAEDPEGNRWSFAQHIRDVPPEEWGATTA
jgi:PhnB protein